MNYGLVNEHVLVDALVYLMNVIHQQGDQYLMMIVHDD
jgi:hypothetical protein